MSAQDEVRDASKQFYAGLNRMANGDAGGMAEIWSHGTAVTTMHPIGGRQVGWDSVRESFSQVAALASEGRIDLQDQMLQVVGETAYELGVEKGEFKLSGKTVHIEHRVTNIYRQEGGRWKIVHHHADISPAMLEVLNSLSKQA